MRDGEVLKNQVFFCKVRRAYRNKIVPIVDITSFKPLDIISLNKELIIKASREEKRILALFNHRYEKVHLPLIKKFFGPDDELSTYYGHYYNKILPLLVEAFAEKKKFAAPEMLAITVMELFGIALAIDDIYDHSAERFGQPAYWIKKGAKQTQAEVDLLFEKLVNSLGSCYSKKIVEKIKHGARAGICLYRKDETQNYRTINRFECCLERWFKLNRGLFDLFSLFKDQTYFDFFFAFSLGTHLLNDLVDVQGLNEDIGSGQYSFALSLYLDRSKNQKLINEIGQPILLVTKKNYQKEFKKTGIDRDISAISASLLTDALNLLKKTGIRQTEFKDWLRARIMRIKAGAYLVGGQSGKTFFTAKN